MTAAFVEPDELVEPTVVAVERDPSGRHIARELRPGPSSRPGP